MKHRTFKLSSIIDVPHIRTLYPVEASLVYLKIEKPLSLLQTITFQVIRTLKSN